MHDGWLYAVGDVNGRNMQTYMGKYHGRIAGDHIKGKPVAAVGDAYAPKVVFTDPQAASVGLSEAEARNAGLSVRTVEYGYGWSGGGSILGYDTEGMCKWVVDESAKVLVGATFADPRRHHRDRGEGAAGRPLARGPALPDDQRVLAEFPSGVRLLAGRDGPTR